jgi:hypothetical protein
LRLGRLSKEEIARSIGDMADNIEAWRSKGRAWKGRPPLAVANSKIAQTFAGILLGSGSE